jgi:hypothetical protein
MKIISKHGLKGHVFDPQKVETLPRAWRNFAEARRALLAERETARYAIVETCKVCKAPLIAEELIAHKTKHISPKNKVRSLVRELVELSPEVRKAVLDGVKEIIK